MAPTTTPLLWDFKALTDFQVDTVNGPTNARSLFAPILVRVDRCARWHCLRQPCLVPYYEENLADDWKKNKSLAALKKWRSAGGERRLVQAQSGMPAALELGSVMITEVMTFDGTGTGVCWSLGTGHEEPNCSRCVSWNDFCWAWCTWLPSGRFDSGKQRNPKAIHEVVAGVEDGRTPDLTFWTSSAPPMPIFTPYQTMGASLYCYKGLPCRRKPHANALVCGHGKPTTYCVAPGGFTRIARLVYHLDGAGGKQRARCDLIKHGG